MVDLPAPLGPTRAIREPRSMSRLTPLDGEFAVAFDGVAQLDDAPRAAIAIGKFDGGRALES